MYYINFDRSGLAQRFDVKNPAILCTDCVIHQQVLTSKTLRKKLHRTLDSLIKMVNYMKSSVNYLLYLARISILITVLLFHTEVHWLSKDNMLACFYGLKQVFILFLEFKEFFFYKGSKMNNFNEG